MKLAEALIQRSDLQRENARFKSRIAANVKVQEGDEPPEDAIQLITAYISNMNKLRDLVILINRTNAETLFEGVMLADKLTERDNLKSKISTLQDVYRDATETFDRYNRNEVKYVCCIDAKKIQYMIDALAKELRELDVKIQAKNWVIELP